MTEYWQRFCDIQCYAFFRGEDSVIKAPFYSGKHIEVDEARELVEDMNEEIKSLRREVAQLKGETDSPYARGQTNVIQMVDDSPRFPPESE